MLKTLAWKEWREQRPVVVAGVAFAIVLPLLMLSAAGVAGIGLDDIVEVLPVAFIGIVWPLLAAAAGAITIANEHESGTIRFLLSRPISRARIWVVKVMLATLAVALGAAASLLVVGIAARAVSSGLGGGITFSSLILGVRTTFYDPLVLTSLSFLLFACSVLCSTLLTRALTAAAAGLALALTLVAAMLLVWGRLSLQPILEPQWLASEVLVVSGGVLLASLLVFSWAELFHPAAMESGSGSRGRLILVAVAALAISAGFLPMVYAGASMISVDAVIDPGSIVFNGRQVVVTMSTATGTTTQIWLLRTDGSGLRPLTGRHTLAPTFLPGGRRVAYRSRRGFAGRRGSGLDLRVSAVGGGSDRLVVRDVPVDAPLFFFDRRVLGRRDDRVMFRDGNELTIARLDGRYHEVYDIGGTALEGAVVLGFTSQTGEELFFLDEVVTLSDGRHAEAVLGVYTVATGETWIVRELAEGWMIPSLPRRDGTSVPAAPHSGDMRVEIPLIAADRVELVHAGGAETVHEFEVGDEPGARSMFDRCATVFPAAPRRWLRTDGRSYREAQLLFADCTAAARDEAVASAAAGSEIPVGLIRLRGLQSGDERTWAVPPFNGRINRIWLSRGQDSVLLDLRGGDDAASFAMLIDLDGIVRRYPSGWIVLGWVGREWLLFQGRQDGEVAFAVGDVITGTDRLRGLYPRLGEIR